METKRTQKQTCFKISEGPRQRMEPGLPSATKESVLQDEKTSEGGWVHNSVNVLNNIEMYK